jgi:hypothetical protein
MQRFLTPSRKDSQENFSMQESLKKMYSGKAIHHNESKDHIANLKNLSQKYDLANSSTDR